MKPYTGIRATLLTLLLALTLAAGLVLPLPSSAGPVALATSPLATSTTSTVKPNILMLLDNSGSMDWDHMPDDTSDGGSSVPMVYGYYGIRSNQCNEIYYDPNITYSPPVNPNGTSYANASFTAAWDNGFKTSTGTVDLRSGFKANQSNIGGNAGGTDAATMAYYYQYTGTVTNPLFRNYNTTGTTFFNECNAANGNATGTAVFSKRRLNDTVTTTITVGSSSAPQATITVTGSSATVLTGGITVNGTQIMSGLPYVGNNNANTVASDIRSRITLGGYTATVSGNVITVTGPPAAAGVTPLTGLHAGGNMVLTYTAFSNPSVSSIKVNGVELMGATSVNGGTNTGTTAGNIAAVIFLNGFSAAVTTNGGTSGPSVITITGPLSAANYAPVITSSSGVSVTAGDVFPDNTASKLTNFANWYSYYRTRLLMMKTATGRAFGSLNQKYRVGFMKLSSSSTPTVYLDTFWDNADSTLGPVTTQRTTWYNALYNTTTSGSTPTRTALSDAGRYYAGQLSGADPLQYSCQQNFTIMSTDGYWNSTAGYKIDGSTPVGNQDGSVDRPMYDGASAGGSIKTTYYTRNNYSSSSKGLGSDASCPKSGKSSQSRRLAQPQTQTCTATTNLAGVTGPTSCGSWANAGSQVYDPPYSSDTTTCAITVALPSPNPSTAVQSGSPVISTATSGGSSDSLADVAMYYYVTDLRTPDLLNCGTPAASGPLCENNVFKSGTDKNQQQHMNTFTLGLGASGWMNYASSYLADTSGDFFSVKTGAVASATVCTWQTPGTVCNWPLPGQVSSGGDGLIANIDDLWHAAVNGRGAYFSATNPATLDAGLAQALTSINAKVGSAAAAATSTLNPVAGNNFAYVASYTTVLWQGNLEARGINVDTGLVDENATWCVENVAAGTCAAPGQIVADTSGSTTSYTCDTQNVVLCTDGTLVGSTCKVPLATACTGTMNAKVTDITDTRTIYTPNAAGTALINFDAAYATANPANFSSTKLAGLTQWPAFTAAQKTAAVGTNLINFLRGQHGNEIDRTSVAIVDQLYRNRQGVMGDALESQPAFIGAPVFGYPYPGYSDFLTAQASRAGTVYIGANDGMMHGFAADTGIERWAYVPSMVIPNMWKLADSNYSIQHVNLVNGSAATSDICTANCSNAGYALTPTTTDDPVWKTILVGGLNGGGRGYYALDITNPTTPVLLWEFTPAQDKDLGYSYGQPVITRKGDGTWVVLLSSGYDNGTDSATLVSGTTYVANSPAGDGKGYLYVLNANTGAIISKIANNTGTAATPSGLARIAGYNAEPLGNAVSYVYGGDLLGNVWRFDINNPASATIGTGSVMKFATLFDAAGVAQPVTTTPILGNISGRRVVFIGTGKYLEVGDLTTTQRQTQYAIEDYDATTTLVNPRTTLVNQTLTNTTSGTRLSSGNTVNWFTQRGWYVDFPDSGERVNIDAKLIEGTLLVPSIVPSNTVCAPGGYGWFNFFDYSTGGSVTPLPGTPVSGVKYDSTIVGINVLFIQGKPIVEVVTSTNPTPQIEPDVTFKASAAGFVGKRVTWRELVP